MVLRITILFVLLPAWTPLLFAEWYRHTIDDSSRGADGVRVADINQDGLPDLVTGWEEGGRIRVNIHPGFAHVRKSWPAVTVGKVKSPEDAVFVDLDQDGKLDVVSCCEGKTRTVYVHWQGDSASSWTTESIPSLAGRNQWMFATPMQIDQAAGVDLVIAAKGSGAEIGWLQAPRDPRILDDWTWHSLATVGWVMSIEAVDMDADGDLDILYTDRKSQTRGVHWLESRPNGTWKRHTIGGTDREVMFLAQGDLNADGLADIAVAVKNRPITWFERLTAEATGWTQHEVDMPADAGSGKGVAVADVDLDGRMELIYTCEHAEKRIGVGWLSPPGDVTRSDWFSHDISGASQGIKFDLIQMLDLDGDGDLDVVTCEERQNLGVIWYENPARSPQL